MNAYQTQEFWSSENTLSLSFLGEFLTFHFPNFERGWGIRQRQQGGVRILAKLRAPAPFNGMAFLAPGSFSSRTVGICVDSPTCQKVLFF